MWPRHTGDFSMFRIYADKNNKPAEYSPENVPYIPKRSLKISLKGMKEGDFTMVFGFPGRTNEYLSSYAIEQIKNISDPAKIQIRHEILSIMKNFMIKDETIKIQYAAKYANIENAYKKWQGEVMGLNKSNALLKKIKLENIFTEKIQSNPDWQNKYGTVLQDLSNAYKNIEPYSIARDCYNEIIPRIETFNIAGVLNNWIQTISIDSSSKSQINEKTIAKLEDIFKEFSTEVDRQLFERLLSIYLKNNGKENISPLLLELLKTKDIQVLTNEIYKSTNLYSLENIKTILSNNTKNAIEIIKNDDLFKLYSDISETYNNNVAATVTMLQNVINKQQRKYMEAQMEIFKEKKFYPDANSTLRVAYGNVKGYKPKDGVKYNFYTYMDGIMEKYKPNDYEFDVPQKLIDLYKAKDFGRYAVNGRQPVCFIASNHTTGGNSGSPALNADGNLVGLNFDRVWEGTMSDIYYDPSICRNIMVDIRYVLFIIDKFAEAKNLINEMSIIN
jgi:hypothetical protein